MGRHSSFYFRLWFAIQAGLVLFCLSVDAGADGKTWWKERPPRIYHPNMRAVEADNFDVKHFIADCKALHAEAIVFSAGGLYAFYDTHIPDHVKSPYLKGRDLLGEVINEAKAHDIKVIARLDFSKARQELFDGHPDWFQLDPSGQPIKSGRVLLDSFYETALLGGYQNEEFAIPVLNELFNRYDISGIHLNAPGFRGQYFDQETIRQHNIPLDEPGRSLWREQALARQMKRFREVIHSHKPDALFMAEINAPENPGWGSSRGFNHEFLAEAYTNLLSTAGEPADEDLPRLRWWAALAADTNRAVGSPASGVPIVNLKAGFKKGKLALKPIGEYAFYCYQALAHRAGIKAPTYGLMQNMPDARTPAMIGDVFKFMERCEPYAASAKPIAPVALIWPGKEQERREGETLRAELLGLYRCMVSKHILFEIVLARRLTETLGEHYQVIVLPSAGLLDTQASEALVTFVKGGGQLVMMDYDPGKPMPEPLIRALGGTWNGEPYRSAYVVPADPPSRFGLPPGPVPLFADIRHAVPPEKAQVWLYSSPTPGGSFVPEEFPLLETGDRAALFSIRAGKGRVVYFAGGLGTMMWENNLPDYGTVLAAMINADSSEEQTLTTDAPSTVNITCYRNAKGTSIHLVNGTGTTPLDEAVSVGPIQVRLRGVTARQATWHAPGRDPLKLDYRTASGSTAVTIPELGAYGLAVLEE